MLVALCVLGAALPAGAETLGIVLMHGKEGSSADRGIAHLAGELESAGYLVERPTMCWSRSRIYDRAFLDCLADIDAAVVSLKARGAEAIVVAGPRDLAFDYMRAISRRLVRPRPRRSPG